MGGLGKTTIAKVTYNQLCGRFESHCFLDNVRENSKRHDGILDLQSKLISNIQNGVVPKLSDVDEGRRRIKDTVCGRKVLIVLDDVDENSQVDKLMGNHSWFGAQSRIIITTRGIDVLCKIEEACQIEGMHDVCTSYKPEYMGNGDSIQLFSKYAFMRDSPMEGYEHLSEEVVSIAAGLPLVLVVLGSDFFGEKKDTELWEAKLKKLREIPHKEVLEKLRFSFDALEYEQKQIFLDIACLFIEDDVSSPSYMWEVCRFHPKVGIRILVSKSLVTIDDDNKFIMHDQLRDLGRQIVREEGLNELGKRSRLWCEEDAMKVLETSQGTSSVNALCLPRERGPVLASSFHGVSYLRYLDMGLHDLDGDFKNSFPNLRWLKWRCTGKFSPTNLQMKNLVILDLSESEFTEDWEDLSQLKMGNKLKVLDLSYCDDIRVLPDLSMFASLELLRLCHCKSLCRLDGLEQLKSLKYLDASRCFNLETLLGLSNLTNLVELNLKSCDKLVKIEGPEKPDSLKVGNKLKVLNLSYCDDIRVLPHFSMFASLEVLRLNGCKSLCRLDGLEQLKSLKYLDASWCLNLETLPSLSNLTNLVELYLCYCKKLVEIQGLEKLESLQKLKIYYCESLERLPDFSNLEKLKKFNASCCSKLIEIEGLEKLESLQKLDITCCQSLERLPDFSNLKKLKTFQASGSSKLTEIEGLEELESLEHLDLRDCDSLKGFLDTSNLINLKELYAPTLEITNFSNLKKLEKLEITLSSNLIDFQGLDLDEFTIALEDYLGSMKRLSELSYLKRLRDLAINNCDEILDLGGLDSLESLSISNCEKLIEIHGVDRLESLKCFRIFDCPSLERLPDLPNFGTLKEIAVDYCNKLHEVEGVGVIESLESLVISDCDKLREIPNLRSLKNLKLLWIEDFEELITRIHGLEELKSLESLRITGCDSIEALPDLSKLEKLRHVHVFGCAKLEDIDI